MLMQTTRFGAVRVQAEDVFVFPRGLIGFEDFRRWVLLADSANDAVGWLQSLGHPDVAVPLVSPRRFVSDYRVRVSRSDLSVLRLQDSDRAFVLNPVARNAHRLTINLKAPVLFNLDRRLACQVITTDDQPVQLDLQAITRQPLRKSA